MTVLYYTSPSFLDISLELINELKKHVTLHILIEITYNTKKSNIIQIDSLPKNKAIIAPEELLDEILLINLKNYFNGTASVNFIVYPNNEIINSLRVTTKAINFINSLKLDIIHLETLSIRSLCLLPTFLKIKKLIFAIHDPVPHSGEGNWMDKILYNIYLNIPIQKELIFYSKYSHLLFNNHFRNNKSIKRVLRLSPYNFYKKYVYKSYTKKHILFFGRLSPYKGLDILLKAMSIVYNKFPEEKLVIAGKSIEGFNLNIDSFEFPIENINVINRYISNEELVSLIKEAKFIVCPYKDATQSGVLMTAFALNTPVIATMAGAFPEYIDNYYNGILVSVDDINGLSTTMINLLDSKLYEVMHTNLINHDYSDTIKLNSNVLNKAFTI